MGLPIESEILLSDKLEKYTEDNSFASYLGEKFDVTILSIIRFLNRCKTSKVKL